MPPEPGEYHRGRTPDTARHETAPRISPAAAPNRGAGVQHPEEKIRTIAGYDGDTRSWYTWIPLDHPEQAAEILNPPFEAARVHGTMVQVHAHPTG
jgi:hypothetical protein